jgi:hypothetical protein
MSKVIHLQGQGDTVWCGGGFIRFDPTHSPEHSNCKECLGKAAEFGKRAAIQSKRI